MKYIFNNIEIIPDIINKNTVYYNQQEIKLICPCGCENLIRLNANSNFEKVPFFLIFDSSIVPSFACSSNRQISINNGEASLL